MAVFFDFDLIFSFSTTQGLSRLTTAISASLPIDKFPALIFNIFAGLQVKVFISVLRSQEGSRKWY